MTTSFLLRTLVEDVSAAQGYDGAMEWTAVMRVFAALEAQRVDYVVIGGVAMNLHGVARATEDIDIFIAPNAENVARLRSALHAVYDDETIEEISAADLCGEYPAVRYVPPAPGPPMDILTRLGDAVHFVDVESERYDVEGQAVSVATPSALYEMKRGTIRPLDHADAARLAAAFNLGGNVKGGE